MFQSAPHFSSEANVYTLDEVAKDFTVSIRASLQQRGEPRLISRILLFNERFQSAPHFSSEANTLPRLTWPYLACFNPRLTSAARRTAFVGDKSTLTLVSIRASLQQRGERDTRCEGCVSAKVSIRASLQQRGEHAAERISTGLTEVSIRASLQQRGERRRAGRFRKEPRCFNPRLTSAARRTRSRRRDQKEG